MYIVQFVLNESFRSLSQNFAHKLSIRKAEIDF